MPQTAHFTNSRLGGMQTQVRTGAGAVRRRYHPRRQTRSNGLPAGSRQTPPGPGGWNGAGRGVCRPQRARPADRHGARGGRRRPGSVPSAVHQPRLS